MTDDPAFDDDAPPFDDEPPSDLATIVRSAGSGRGGRGDAGFGDTAFGGGGGGGSGGGGRSDGGGGGGRSGGSGGRVPPHNLDAERALLGALLLSRDAVAAAAEVIPGADVFYRPAHAHIYEAITVLTARGEVADPIVVAEELRRRDLLDAAGGTSALDELQLDAPGSANAAHYARIVKDHALLRRLIGAAGSISESAYGLPEDVRKAVDEAESLVFDIARHEGEGTTAQLTDLLGDTLTRIEELHDRGSEITGTPTGYYDLDEMTAGLQPGALIVIGARPAMGKTALSLGIATNAALKADKAVLLFNLEMSKLELVQRILCAEARVDSKRIRNGRLSDADWNGIATAMGRLGDAKIWIDDNPNVSIMEIRSKARRLRSETGDLGLVIVDYIQLMTGRSNAESRQVEVAEISRGLKLLARELECPVVALAQLNRGLEQRADKRPMLSDLRESGSLEQDADIVMFLYRDEVYEPTPENQGLAEVIVAKQRNGPTGVARLSFLGHLTRFESMPKDE